MDPKVLLQALMDERGWNPNRLSKETGGKTKQPQIHRYLAGEVTEPKRSTFTPVAKVFGVPVEAFFDEKVADAVAAQLAQRRQRTLTTGRDDVLDGYVTELRVEEASRPYRLGESLDHAPDLHGPVPLIKSWVQAGAWNEPKDAVRPDIEDWLWSPRPVSSRSFALRVRGDSMTAPYGLSYKAGCIIFVDPEKRSPVNGDRIIAVQRGSNEATFKVFKQEDGRTWLAPLNTQTHLPIHEPFDIIGTVIGQWNE